MPAKSHTLSSKFEARKESARARSEFVPFDQVNALSDEDRDHAFRRIKAAAKRLGFDIPDTHWQQLGHPAHP
jgi:hypothetical protein